MAFRKGADPNRAKGGKRHGAGRPSKQKKAIAKAAAEMAREFIEQHAMPVLETYLKNAKGHYEKRFTYDGQEYEVWVVDAATTRHWIDKLVPASKQELDVNVHGQVQVFTNVDPHAGRTKKS